MSWIVRHDLPTPPPPTTTNLYLFYVSIERAWDEVTYSRRNLDAIVVLRCCCCVVRVDVEKRRRVGLAAAGITKGGQRHARSW